MKLRKTLWATLSLFALPLYADNPLTQFINWITPPLSYNSESAPQLPSVTIPPSPHGPIVISPDGEFAYVVDTQENVVVPIDIETETMGDPISVGISPVSITISSNGAMAYVTNAGDNTLTPIILESHYPAEPIVLEDSVEKITLSDDGNTIYVTYSNGTTATVNFLALPLE